MYREKRSSLLALVSAMLLGSCNWISLARSALNYPTVGPGEAANLAMLDTLIYATMGDSGIAILSGSPARTIARIAPPPGSESVDDIAIVGNLLFALDARPPGHLSVFSLNDPLQPRLVSKPRTVPVGPFSGVSAQRSLVVVSGGTSALTAWRYDSTGVLAGSAANADLGRGQPNALVAPDGRTIYVATHRWGPYFGLGILQYDSAAHRLNRVASLDLDGAGFTEGGAKPASFPIDLALLGDDTLLVAHARGIAIVRVAAPPDPRLLETIDVGGPAVNITTRVGTVAVTVSGSRPAVVLLDFSRATPVTRRFPLEQGTFPLGVAFSGSRMAVAARERGVLTIE